MIKKNSEYTFKFSNFLLLNVSSCNTLSETVILYKSLESP